MAVAVATRSSGEQSCLKPHRQLKPTSHFAEDLFPFLQWATPYCGGRQFVGYFIEEYACQPILIYVSDGQVYLREVREPPNSVIDGSTWPETHYEWER
jgi:hypothetical protein